MRRGRLAAASLVVLLLTSMAPVAAAERRPSTAANGPTPSAPPAKIHLKSRSFEPAPGLERAAIVRSARGSQRVHFFIQFKDLPDNASRKAFKARGIDLVSAVTGGTYIGAAATGNLNAARGLAGFRWAGPIAAADKIDPALAQGAAPAWARTGDGRVALTIQVHPDVGPDVAAQIARAHGGEVIGETPAAGSATALFNPAAVPAVAQEDAVQYVAPLEPALGEHNDGVVPAIGATPLAAAPYNLTGAGVTIMVYDSGMADVNHPDFAGRVVQTDPDTGGTTPVPTRRHSTHVAGTALGSGANSNGVDSAGAANNGTANQWAGVAPGANLATYGSQGNNASTDVLYDSAGDINADVTTAIGGGIDLATMSLGNNTGANGLPCGQLGDYTNTSILLDNIVRGSVGGQQLIYVESAGNDRNQACAPASGFSTITSPAPAKNTIVVGAINSNDNSMTNFSSWGPVDDGRLRPDVVAPGCQSNGDFNVTSPAFADPNGNGQLDAGEVTNGYATMCGTSMATPAVAGTLALVIQQWRATMGAGTRPLPHTAKALLAHTATDLGNVGPDFANGFGAVNAQAAVDLVRANGAASLITVDQVDQGNTDTWYFASDGSAPPRVTLAWSDPAATRLSTTQLINNLDLVVTGPDNVVHRPLILNAGSPANNAAEGTDNLNVVEMVVGHAAAGSWKVTVGGTAVPTGPQAYTLITPTGATASLPPTADAGGPYTVVEGGAVTLSAAGSSDPANLALTYAWDLDNDGQFDDSTSISPSFTATGQDGAFTVRVRVTNSAGLYNIDSATVTVTNAAPVVNLASNGPKPENTAITISGSVTDAGWLDTLTATINWGDGGGPVALPGTLENDQPTATLSFSASHVYGDNGTYPVTVCGADDDTTTCGTIGAVITNVAPTATIDETGTTTINGVPTFLAPAGTPINFRATSTDPGSDDLYATWDWDTSTAPDDETRAYLVNPPSLDGPMSPTIQPRSIEDLTSHTFGRACLYDIAFTSLDDDGDSATDTGVVLITGNSAVNRTAGYWKQQMGSKPDLDPAVVVCYLKIAGFASDVFDEVRDASTRAKASVVLTAGGSDAKRHLDLQLLALWLNFANGGTDWTQLVDTDGDRVADTPLSTVLINAEAVRLAPGSTRTQLLEQAVMLERINRRDG